MRVGIPSMDQGKIGKMDVSQEDGSGALMTTAEVAALLRVKERKIYDLVAEDAIPHTKVTGKILFPRDLIDAWIRSATTGASELSGQEPALIMAGSHDPLLEWAMVAADAGIGVMFDGSMDGYKRFQAGEVIATGMHVPSPGTEAAGDNREIGPAYNTHLLNAPDVLTGTVLVTWVQRRTGVIHAGDLDLTTQDWSEKLSGLAPGSVQRRQETAGSQILFEQLLAEAGIEGEQMPWSPGRARTETEAALAIVDGSSAAAFGVEAVAQRFRLAFLPLAVERYDILIRQRDYFAPQFQRLLSFVRTESFAQKADQLGGYDLSRTGEIAGRN